MKIAVIATGGTIGTAQGETNRNRLPQALGAIQRMLDCPPSGLEKIKTTLVNPFTLLSENIAPRHWPNICAAIQKQVDSGADAIVVTHGTDTMAYSVCAATFMLQRPRVPIVFTGATKPAWKVVHGPDESDPTDVELVKIADSDAFDNLWDAIRFAAGYQHAGIFLVFGSRSRKSRFVYWGPHVQPIRLSGTTFDSIDGKYVAKIDNNKLELGYDPLQLPRSGPNAEVNKPDLRIDARVELLKVFPGLTEEAVQRLLLSNTKGVILELYHSGTACSQGESTDLRPAIEALKERGVPAFGPGVPLGSDQYESTTALIKSGLIPLRAITVEAAFVKLACLLGRGFGGKDLHHEMATEQMGEFAEHSKT